MEINFLGIAIEINEAAKGKFKATWPIPGTVAKVSITCSSFEEALNLAQQALLDKVPVTHALEVISPSGRGDIHLFAFSSEGVAGRIAEHLAAHRNWHGAPLAAWRIRELKVPALNDELVPPYDVEALCKPLMGQLPEKMQGTLRFEAVMLLLHSRLEVFSEMIKGALLERPSDTEIALTLLQQRYLTGIMEDIEDDIIKSLQNPSKPL